MPIENRKYVRYVIRLAAVLETENGNAAGFTRDLSVRGLLFLPGQAININKNDQGTIKIDLLDEIISAPCTIRHFSNEGIGLSMEQLDSKHATRLTQLLENTLKLSVGNTNVECTPDNRLVHLEDWNEQVAEKLAEREGITLTKDHWNIINLMREYYDEYRLCPNENVIKEYILEHLSDEQALDTFIYNLFPSGLVHQASRLSGIPLPLEDHIVEAIRAQKNTYTSESLQLTKTEAIEFDGHTYHFTVPGNLIEHKLWNDRLGSYIAKRQNIELTHAHWEVIHFLRYFYSEYSIVPNVNVLKKHLHDEESDEWKDKANDEYLYQLFPKGPCRQGAIIAGLPEPHDCID